MPADLATEKNPKPVSELDALTLPVADKAKDHPMLELRFPDSIIPDGDPGSETLISKTAPIEDPDLFSAPKEERNPNRTWSKPSIAINGMNMTDTAIDAMCSMIAEWRGHEVQAIRNHTDGFSKDIMHCIASAFSARKGAKLEAGAAGELAELLGERQNDEEPIVIDAYSQGTLIARNVLALTRAHLIDTNRENDWNDLASRIKIQSYGAAVHRWPEGIKDVIEYRHIGDGVAAVGDFVTMHKSLNDVIDGQLGERSSIVFLPQLLHSHSIAKYFDNAPAFFAASLKGNHQERAQTLLSSMSEGQLGKSAYNEILAHLVEKTALPELVQNVKPANNAIRLLREIHDGLLNDPAARSLLFKGTESAILKASEKPQRTKPKRSYGAAASR